MKKGLSCHPESRRRHDHKAACRAVCHLFLRRKQREEEEKREGIFLGGIFLQQQLDAEGPFSS